jgi:DHA1 family tetracycline resistance protein-like MFS transporter
MLANAEKTRIGVLYLVALVDSLGFNIFSNVLPVLADSSDPRHHEGSEALSPGTAYSILQFTFCIGVAVFPPFAGRFSDSRGRRPILLISLAMLLC